MSMVPPNSRVPKCAPNPQIRLAFGNPLFYNDINSIKRDGLRGVELIKTGNRWRSVVSPKESPPYGSSCWSIRMKSIKLPISQTMSSSIDLGNLTKDDVVEVDGKRIIKMGAIDVAAGVKELNCARENGAQVVYAATSVETQLEDFLLLYFIGPFLGPDERRDFFVHNVLQSSGISYSFKKELVLKIVDKYGFVKGKDKSDLTKCLKSIMDWRNAFAHGRLEHDSQLGAVLRFFSGSPKAITLNDEYWSQVEECFENARRLVKCALDGLRKRFIPLVPLPDPQT